MRSALSRPQAAALVGLLALVLVVPLMPRSLLPVDAVIVLVPIVLALAFPLSRILGVHRLPFYTVEVPGVLFLVLAFASSAVVAPRIDSLLTIARYASYVLLVVAVGAITRDERMRRATLWAILAGGAGTLAMAAYQIVAPGRSIGLRGLGPSVSTRVYATFENPNFYAEYLVLLFAVCLALALTERGLPRFIARATLIATSAILLLTYTRGSWIALAMGLLITLAMVNIRLVVPLIAVGGVGVVLIPGVAERVMSIFSLEGSASFRLGLWRIAGEAILTRPLFGIGAGNFTDAFREIVLTRPELSLGYLEYGAHSSALTITAEMGILAGVAFLWLIFGMARSGLYLMTREGLTDAERLQSAAITSGLVAFVLNSFTSNAFQHPQAAVFFFILAGIQAGVGLRVLHAPERAIAFHGPHHLPAALDSSAAVGVGRAMISRVKATWPGALVRRVLFAPPPFGGQVATRSAAVRVLFGEGDAEEPGCEGRSPDAAQATT